MERVKVGFQDTYVGRFVGQRCSIFFTGTRGVFFVRVPTRSSVLVKRTRFFDVFGDFGVLGVYLGHIFGFGSVFRFFGGRRVSFNNVVSRSKVGVGPSGLYGDVGSIIHTSFGVVGGLDGTMVVGLFRVGVTGTSFRQAGDLRRTFLRNSTSYRGLAHYFRLNIGTIVYVNGLVGQRTHSFYCGVVGDELG